MPPNQDNGSPSDSRPRRPSFTEFFGGRGAPEPSINSNSPNNGKTVSPAMATAMAQQAQQSSSQTRRLSITTLGLSGSPPQTNPPTSPFGSLRRGHSVTDGGTRSSIDESENAVDDTDASGAAGVAGGGINGPNGSPFGRRVSFGAMTYNQMRSFSFSGPSGDVGVNGSNGQASNNFKSSSPPSSKTREGFNWTENLRKRAERSSISAASGSGGFLPLTSSHNRVKSGTSANDPTPPMPAPKPAPKAPDHFQERILKGDFYMD